MTARLQSTTDAATAFLNQPLLDEPLPGEHHLGDEPAVTGDGAHTTVHRLGRISFTGGFDLPGEFDLPPEHEVRLVGEVPWELRDAEAEE